MAKTFKVIKYTRKTKSGVFEYDMVLDTSRFGKQLSRAQFALDVMVMNDMLPYMPMDTGQFINVTRAMSASIAGTGKVVAAAPPFGRFLYEGKTMVDEKTGSPWARKGARKVLVSQYTAKSIKASPNLDFSTGANPDAQPHWFEVAKEKHGSRWIAKTKKTGGGGK